MPTPVTTAAIEARRAIAFKAQVQLARMKRDADAEVRASNASYAAMRRACEARAQAGILPYRVARLVEEAIWRNRP